MLNCQGYVSANDESSLGGRGSSEIETLLRGATAHLSKHEFSSAQMISEQIRVATDRFDPEIRVQGDNQPRPYTIAVVAHVARDEHHRLVNTLINLNCERFEIIFLENAMDDIWVLPIEAASSNVTVARLKFNAGIGVARNLALRLASGEGIIFIDDDGHASAASIESLISTFEVYKAAAVRGRVVLKTSGLEPPAHYAPGTDLRQHYCDIEGFAVWRTASARRVGGFDPILYGHEGVDLTARMFPFEGPDAFLYEPSAVLEHDFSRDTAGAEMKHERHRRLRKYCGFKAEHFDDVLRLFESQIHRNPVARATLFQRKWFVADGPTQVGKAKAPVGILTTCYNGGAFIPDFAAALAAQTDDAIELIFVDDGSDDGSVEMLDRYLPPSISRRVIEGGRLGRSGALNLILDAATTELCMIADVDDIMFPYRTAWTRKAYEAFPDADMIGFMICDYNLHSRASRPLPVRRTNLQVRKLLGMPAPFPAFSFKRASITEQFDVGMTAGIDCDWLFRSLNRGGCQGYILPLLAAFYRTHNGQITTTSRETQRAVALQNIAECHASILGTEPKVTLEIEMLTGWTPIRSGQAFWQVNDYAVSLMEAMADKELPWADEAAIEITRHLDAVRLLIARNDSKATAKAAEEAQSLLTQKVSTIAEVSARCAEIETEIERVMSSNSMKITAPLRALARIIRGE
ncbi:glycosyltransferase family 2 protein [Paracoccus jeotgali]|uniref:glycosyltransferase family 2 protein n=1 Tax=Paracoccus jeotgali TaxID=2065379 RepID=UPI001315A4E8|nr:glycosyltransferase [Paracoccus jeotgali]